MAGLTGLNGLAGINALQEDNSEASPEDRMGGPADPFHGHWGEQGAPYPWESSLAMGGSHGPYGLENQMLGDELWFIEPGGMAEDDPTFDYNIPNVKHSHGSVKNVALSGTAPSQYDAINAQVAQQGNHASDMQTSRKMSHWDGPQNDQWEEIWDVEPGTKLYSNETEVPGRISHQAAGFGSNDHVSNSYAKRNQYGFDSSHHHRRIATGSIPGNYMWMRPGGRPLFKTFAGPGRPAIGANSPFQGDDVGAAFAYDNGAILQQTPTAYVPPPSPNVNVTVPAYDDPMGTDGIELW